MSNSTIPATVRLAARRGFIRTTAQAYSTALAGGASAATVIAIIEDSTSVTAYAVTAAVAVLSPLLAGASSYLSIIARGVPEEYANTEDATPTS